MKHEWRKKEKGIYLPKNKPMLIEVPSYTFLTITGAGNPNSPHFADYIGVLYSLSYAIKMSPKKMDLPPIGYYDYTVYPLEGVWDITEEAKKTFDGRINKEDLVFQLMIRQPDFLEQSFFEEMLALTKKKKPHPLLEQVQLEEITEGPCIQMLHIGPYEEEDKSFAVMEAFAKDQQRTRVSKIHREIYLSDFRRVAPEKLKTVLRFSIHS
ncbi:MAG: GyrI-like domain-containing protein [Aureispira sp.]